MRFLGFNLTRVAPPSPRDPRPATLSTRSCSSEALAWLSGSDSDTSGPVLSNAYQQCVWVYRAINVLAEQISNLPFLFSRGERGRENLITSGPLHRFYDQPHPQINRFQYWELRVIWLMLRGECFRIPLFSDSPSSSFSSSFSSSSSSSTSDHHSTLKSVLILDPSHFHHIIDDHKLAGWRYTGFGPNTPLESQIFLPEEVWHEKLPNPFDFWRGMPPLYVATVAAQTDFAASAFMKGLMENNADLGVIVRTDQQLDDAQQDQILAALRNRKRKAGTADRPLLLWSGAQIEKPHLSSADLQFLDNRKFSRAEICAAFGVPEEIVSITDNNKYDVMAGSRLNFIENRIAPLCARLEAEEQKTIRSLQPDTVGWFDIDSLPIMQQARRTRIASAKAAFDMGVPFNELNRVLDLGFSPLPWGNRGYLPAKLQPLGENPER